MGQIRIEKNEIKSNILKTKLSVSKDLVKYIRSSELFIEYDEEINADDSILGVPLIATVLPLAWLTGSDILVGTLDKGFKESMERLQILFKQVYPLIQFRTEIKTENIVENKIDPEDPGRRTGLLFSGGIDATYSMYTNLGLNPRLIMHWGVERTPYPVYKEYWEMVIEKYSKFAEKYGLSFNITKSNVLEILDHLRIEHKFHKELLYGSLWVRLQESLILLSLAAPLSIKRFDRLLLAASEWPNSIETRASNRPYTTSPKFDEVIGWANLNVKHDGFIERLSKIEMLSDYIDREDVTLRVCLNRKDAPTTLNCNHCEKCCRSIVQLIQAGIDPNKCGFNVIDSSPFKIIKDYYLENGLDSFALDSKRLISKVKDQDLYGSKEYFKWLRDFDLPEQEIELIHRDIYDALPYPLAKILFEFYKVMNIKIHYGNPKIPQKRIDRIMKTELTKREY